jgi:hypothetical protein
MARKKTAARRRSGTVAVQRVPASPIVVVNEPKPPATRRRRRSASPTRRASSRKGKRRLHFEKNLQNTMIGLGAGGAIIGFVEKKFGTQIPELPFVGRKGAIALAVLFLKPKNEWIQDAGKAAAALAGYELGTTGKVTGLLA